MWRCENHMWRCDDVQVLRWADVKAKRCEGEKVICVDVRKRRCEGERMWRWEDDTCRCEGEKMISVDAKMWRWEDVKMICVDVRIRKREDEKMRCVDVKMRRCQDEKMMYRPPLLEEPSAQTLSGKKGNGGQISRAPLNPSRFPLECNLLSETWWLWRSFARSHQALCGRTACRWGEWWVASGGPCGSCFGYCVKPFC